MNAILLNYQSVKTERIIDEHYLTALAEIENYECAILEQITRELRKLQIEIRMEQHD